MSAKNKNKVVVIGGGTGMPVLLRGLKEYPVDITAIVTVADDGGSSGKLRDELLIPPPGDVRNVLIALAEVEPLFESLFQHRFENGSGLSGHALGNLLLAAMTNITGDFAHGISEMSRVLNVRGKVLPAANQSIVLHAELEDGTLVSGESLIPKHKKKIKRVFLTPEDIEPPGETLHEIAEADMIVFGPGSLYTSILPNLLVPKIGQAICQAKAKKVYVCNVMTQSGETTNYTASDHLKALYDHIPCRFVDAIIVNDEQITSKMAQRYAKEDAEPVIYDMHALQAFGCEVIHDNIIEIENEVVRHDAKKVAQLLHKLLPHQ